MSRRSPFAALALAVLVAVACSVYGPGDLVGPDTNPFPTINGGQSGASSMPSYGGLPSGGFTFGGFTSGGYSSGGRGSGGGAGRAGAMGAGGHAGLANGGSPASGGARPSGGREGGAAGASSRGGSTGDNTGGSATAMSGAAGENPGGASGGNATGGAPPSTGGGGAGAPSTGGAAPIPPELIDNMEDGNAYILKNDGRDGTWYTAFGTGGSAEPSAASITMALLEGEAPVAGSKRGFHFKAEGGDDWGALCGFDFVYVATGKPKLPYDASHYKGVEFWIKGAAAASLVVRIPLKDTSADAKGKCTATDGACENHFKASIDVTTSWRKISLEWGAPASAFEQEPWGYTLPAFDPTQLIAVQFLVSKGDSAEFWLDDVSLIAP